MWLSESVRKLQIEKPVTTGETFIATGRNFLCGIRIFMYVSFIIIVLLKYLVRLTIAIFTSREFPLTQNNTPKSNYGLLVIGELLLIITSPPDGETLIAGIFFHNVVLPYTAKRRCWNYFLSFSAINLCVEFI